VALQVGGSEVRRQKNDGCATRKKKIGMKEIFSVGTKSKYVEKVKKGNLVESIAFISCGNLCLSTIKSACKEMKKERTK